MKKRKKILSDHSGMTLVEILTAFFILMLASKAVVSCISGYSHVIEKSGNFPRQAQKWNA